MFTRNDNGSITNITGLLANVYQWIAQSLNLRYTADFVEMILFIFTKKDNSRYIIS